MDELKNQLPSHIYDALTNGSVNSLKVIVLKTNEEISNLTGLHIKDVEKVKLTASKIVLKKTFLPASEVPEWRRLSTGCSVIDNITRGGIPVNGITELYGQSGVGKTQFCMQLALMAQLPKKLGGLEKGVLYICTEDVFPFKRLKHLTQFFSLRFAQLQENIKFEDNIFIEHIGDFEQLRRLICVRVDSMLTSNKIGLIIIDSIAALFRGEENINYVTRSQDLVILAKKLHSISVDHEVAVLCVNQVTDNIETNMIQPSLGLAWSNMVTCRFELSRNPESEIRKFRIIFAPDLPPDRCQFLINSDGLCSIE